MMDWLFPRDGILPDDDEEMDWLFPRDGIPTDDDGEDDEEEDD